MQNTKSTFAPAQYKLDSDEEIKSRLNHPLDSTLGEQRTEPFENVHVDASSAAETSAKAPIIDEFTRFGWVPFYRTWIEEWWFSDDNWSRANLFMWMLCRANRNARTSLYRGKTILINRGSLVTSYKKLAEQSKRDERTIKQWIADFESAGMVKLVSTGAHGIVASIVDYDRYALDSKKHAPPMQH